MSESKSKVIERNRAPRVQITYEVEHYGSPTTIELPFVMGVMADLAGKSTSREAQKPAAERNFVEVDAGRFPAFMDALAPRVTARIPDRLPAKEGEDETAERELFVDLTFRNMGDFAPDRIAEQVPELAELLKMRRRLEELLSYMDGKSSAEKRIAQLLNDEPLLARIAEKAMTGSDKAEG